MLEQISSEKHTYNNLINRLKYFLILYVGYLFSDASISKVEEIHEAPLPLLVEHIEPKIVKKVEKSPPTSAELLARVGNYNHPSQQYFSGVRSGERQLSVCVLNRDNPLGKRANVRESQIYLIK